MKANQFPITIHVYDGLIKTYAGACKAAGVAEHDIDTYIKDAWVLFRQMESRGVKVQASTLNSMLLLHVNALRDAEAEGQIMPLFTKYGIEPDMITYQHLMCIAAKPPSI